jgi:hypothetical protein
MVTTMEWPTPAAIDEPTIDPERRPVIVQLYLDRLARLVQLDSADIPGLSVEEQQRLRTRAVVGAIEALTALDAGPSASELLRAVRR